MPEQIALGCSDCGAVLTATVEGQHDAQVRHTREETYEALTIDAAAFHAAVSQHRVRGCPARHFKQVHEPEPPRVPDPDDDGRYLIA
ncbi:hypothetical protein SEA_NERGAL_83 [Mycobacterium Phage Nergal]|nr:hypothetical protein SEA_NERGAL_83 [Mycobacterium Phage Nergal]